MLKKMIPYGKQSINRKDISAVKKALKDNFITSGPTLNTFEREIAQYVNAKYAVAVSSGTAALHMAAFAADIKAGDEVLVPAMTFAASANCVLYQGGTPVFVDTDETINIDINDLKKKITPKTKAIIPVDFTGQSVDIDKIMAIAKKHNLIVIEDAAHALGSEYKGRKVGSDADMTMFSFHPVKPITTGEGGVIVTNNKEFYERMLMFRTHGITKDQTKIKESHGPWFYEQHYLGYNYRLTDIQAALGLSQLKRLDKFINKRRKIKDIYNSAFKDFDLLKTPNEPDFSNSGWHLYIIRLNLDKLTVSKKVIYEALLSANIGVMVHYIPVYFHPYYQNLGYKKGLCPVTEKTYDEMLSLPIFPTLKKSEVMSVIKIVFNVLNKFSK